MQVIIMRGLPGSGKSTWVKNCAQDQMSLGLKVVVCSADAYHTLPDGSYKFDPAKIKLAHDNCLSKFLNAINPDSTDNRYVMEGRKAISHLIVDNTNTTAWEIAPYYRLAELYNHSVKIIRVDSSLEIAVSRNTHKVPDRTMLTMMQNLTTERLPQHWNEEVVFSG